MYKKATESGSGKSGYAITIGASTMFSQVISRGGDIAKAYNCANRENKRSLFIKAPF